MVTVRIPCVDRETPDTDEARVLALCKSLGLSPVRPMSQPETYWYDIRSEEFVVKVTDGN